MTIVYVDGPALLYHLLLPPGAAGGNGLSSSSLPPPAAARPSSQRRKGRYHASQSACPAEVHSLVYSFVSALLSAGASRGPWMVCHHAGGMRMHSNDLIDHLHRSMLNPSPVL
mmetsp:Transcript_24341/g.45031  ORF Transcript_24341/g.45031 Transcript_24341/m.45031 type:complete len:113 (-) Transcript_24341:232-570(-)|eukprot:CAMPEP_0197437134 /NCGR_PEP_ID=MMETSP1175-20131217/4438_1 /TAXON_ID=1003142 /ORGANISM="Triceratium dubium, Strain CCMP147" /LENGTH=112 /DNA_ID=CAMNT_0042966581 /DNA_START=734 /DNA_END=1072 /DNA_ORIENTATION=-